MLEDLWLYNSFIVLFSSSKPRMIFPFEVPKIISLGFVFDHIIQLFSIISYLFIIVFGSPQFNPR